MTPTIVLTLDHDISVVVPDSLDLITCYVLQEQEDWFEDEIKFVRKLLQPGQRAIDIGANYGLFTLSMAKSLGPHGHVWAFEPASSTAALLAQSIAHNRYDHITLDRRALSDHEGTAQLSLKETLIKSPRCGEIVLRGAKRSVFGAFYGPGGLAGGPLGASPGHDGPTTGAPMPARAVRPCTG